MVKLNDTCRQTRFFLLATLTFLVLFLAVDNLNAYRHYVSLAVIACWTFTLIDYYPIIDHQGRKLVNVAVAMLLLISFYRFIHVSNVSLENYLRDIEWLMCAIISVYAVRLFSLKSLKYAYVIYICIIFLSLVVYAMSGRSLSMEGLEDETSQIASAAFSSMTMLFSAVCMMILFHTKKKKTMAVCIVFLVLSVYVNFFILQRATNIILTFFIFILLLLLNARKSYILKALVVLTIIIGGILYSTGLYIPLLDEIAATMPDRVAVRIQAISISLQMQDVMEGGGSLSARSELMTNSWLTFTSSVWHFLIGVGDVENSMIVGKHSFILDTLARYGVVGGFIMFLFFKNQIKVITSVFNRSDNERLYLQCIAVYGVYIFRSFIGNVSTALISTLMLLFFPSVLILLNNKKI